MFDLARSGKRVGVLAGPRADIAGGLQKCYSSLTMDDRMGIDLYRSFNAITVEWPNGGLLKIAGRVDTFRGLEFDRVFIPEGSDLHTRKIMTVVVLRSAGTVEEYS